MQYTGLRILSSFLISMTLTAIGNTYIYKRRFSPPLGTIRKGSIEILLYLLESYFRISRPFKGFTPPQNLKKWQTLVSRLGDESIESSNSPYQAMNIMNALGQVHQQQSLYLIGVCLQPCFCYQEIEEFFRKHTKYAFQWIQHHTVLAKDFKGFFKWAI